MNTKQQDPHKTHTRPAQDPQTAKPISTHVYITKPTKWAHVRRKKSMINLIIFNASLSFDLTKISREKLYGKLSKLKIDKYGNECIRAELFDSTILTKGTTSRCEKIATRHKKEIEKIPSTLNIAQQTKKCEFSELLNYDISSCLALTTTCKIPKNIQKNLETHIYQFTFNFRKSFSASTAFLIKSNGEYFALIGNLIESDWIDHNCDTSTIQETNIDFDDLF